MPSLVVYTYTPNHINILTVYIYTIYIHHVDLYHIELFVGDAPLKAT